MSRKHKPPPKKPPPPPVEEDEEEEEEGPTLEEQFRTFIQYKNEEDPGTHILLSQSDFWMKHAGIIQGRKFTTTDTGICFFKFKKYKLNYQEYLEFLQNLAAYKNIRVDEIIDKLVSCGPPPAEVKVGLAIQATNTN